MIGTNLRSLRIKIYDILNDAKRAKTANTQTAYDNNDVNVLNNLLYNKTKHNLITVRNLELYISESQLITQD